MSVLNKLGETINLCQNESLIELKILKAKRLFGNSFQEILSSNDMSDKVLCQVMKFYNSILFSSYHANRHLFIVISCKFGCLSW